MHLPYKTKYIYTAIAFLAIGVFFSPLKVTIQRLLIGFSQGLILAPSKASKTIETQKKENILLALKAKEQEHLLKENKRLKKAFDFKSTSELNLTGAEVITFLPSNWRRVVVVNAGKDKAIKQGQLAIDENGNLLGKILEVMPESCRLILINDPDFNLSVFVGENGFGLLKGNIWGAKILYIEDGDLIKKGDRVWTKTPESVTAIEIGKIKKIKKRRNNLFWDVDVDLASKNNVFTDIFIIK